MNLLNSADIEFSRRFQDGEVPPSGFDHRSHLRLAYIHLVTHGPVRAVDSFRGALTDLLQRNGIDATKFHETLTRAWLLAVWHFMERVGDTTSSDEFLQRSAVLHDPKVMLSHYSKGLLFGAEARTRFVAPDLDPIPRRTNPDSARAT